MEYGRESEIRDVFHWMRREIDELEKQEKKWNAGETMCIESEEFLSMIECHIDKLQEIKRETTDFIDEKYF